MSCSALWSKEFLTIIQNKKKLSITEKDQLLLYVKKKRGLGKRWVTHTLEMGFALLESSYKLVFSTIIRYIAKDIGRIIIYIAFSINNCKT